MVVRRNNEVRKLLIDEHRIIGSLMANEIKRWQNESKWPFDALYSLSQREGFKFWWIVDENNKIHLSDDVSFIGTHGNDYLNQRSDHHTKVSKNLVNIHTENGYGVYSESYTVGRKTWMFIHGFSLVGIDDAKREILVSALINLIVSGIIIGIVLFFLVRHFIRPLEILHDGVKKVGSGDLKYRITDLPNDELGHLASAINSMADELQQRDREQKKNEAVLAHYKNHLEDVVEERTQKVIDMQEKLVDHAHKAGMAEIATGALHNVGNILNSINTSASVIRDTMNSGFKEKFTKANSLLSENLDTIEYFILENPKGKNLLNYYLELGKVYNDVYDVVQNHSERLHQKVEATIAVVHSQQQYAGTASLVDQVNMSTIIHDAIATEQIHLDKANIKIETRLIDVSVKIEKQKFFHVLVNLIKNAIDAMENTPIEKRVLVLSIEINTDTVVFTIEDSGCGIDQSNRLTVFNHGFTTKKTGNGFGLHSSANYINDMGGLMECKGDSEYGGASFKIEFPNVTMGVV